MNTNYQRGRRNEYRSMRLLAATGYLPLRTAGSHGPFDVIGVGASDIVLVQVKSNGWPTPAEMEQLQLIRVPGNARKLVHRWDTRKSDPQVREV